MGLVRPDVMKQLLKYPEVITNSSLTEIVINFFKVFRITSGCVELNPAFRDYEERSTQVDNVLRELRTGSVFIALKGWRDEVSPTPLQPSTNPLPSATKSKPTSRQRVS